MRMKITNAGRAKLVNGTNTGTNTVLISQIGLTSTGFTPTAAMTQLPGEFKRMTSFGGESVAADTIHVTLQDSGTDKYPLRGFGLYLADGTLFAVYGQAEAIMEKASISTLLLSADVVFADIDTAQIKFGSTQFLNPPATETVAGVVELADSPETILGTDAVRAVTARGLKATLDSRFGANAPTPFVKTVLALATAAAIRTSLELKGAALKDMGHGKGLDADTLDGMHAADFPQIGKVQPIDSIPGNSNQVRWIKLGTLPWRGAAASILLLEMTNGAIGSPRYAWEQIAASTRTFSDTTTVLTQAVVDGMVQHTRIGADSSLDRPSRFGLVLSTDAAGKSTGVELWLQQREYNQGHAVRVVNATGATYHGPGTFVTAEPQGIIYATAQPLAYMGDLRKLVDATENTWGRLQRFNLGASMPNDQRFRLGDAGGELRGTPTGSVVVSSGQNEGGFVYLRPNGTHDATGQLVVYKTGIAHMAAARIGTGAGDGSVLCELNSERPWQIRQAGTEGNTALEFFDTSGGKEIRFTNTANSNKISLNPSGSWIYAAEFKGKLTGNADTASKLAAPRAINGTNFDGATGITTATWGTARNIQIGNATKSVNGGANVSFTLAEIGAGSAADVAARVAYLKPTTDDDSWVDTWDALRINRQGSASLATMPAQYTIAWSLPSYDNSRGLAIAADYGGGNRFWMRSRRDTAPADQRWKGWVELWSSANFDPATKANLSGAEFTGGVSTPWVKAKSNNFMGGPVYAVLSPDGTGGQVLLRPNGAASAVGQLKATVSEVSWDGKGIWHAGNLDPASMANRIPGQVIMFAGKSAPAGTLLCNGAAVSRTTYADLFAAIGTLYGAGDGKTTFNLPKMDEGAVVAHTTKADSVGTPTAGEVIGHTHTGSAASAGAHTHAVTVAAGGAHSHGASASGVGDHAHGAWTDSQGHHAHTGGTSAVGDHQHLTAFAEAGIAYPWGADYGQHAGSRGNADYDNPWPNTSPAGAHSHSFTTDGAGGHAHNIGMNGAGAHSHDISIAQVGDHGHTASAASGGAHSHTVTVDSTGGTRNLAAGLRMIYCITY
ncbi:tail fiber protein [Stenotrophomonas maltophilia]|uniref:phage tail protein n=1 Tax=Stenotrophomonas maltophilia TaxID=40324 RepID=UPI0020979C92|nr:tail fiber protein [Stenotrophomonas maltophilia]MCO7400667.1 tail fiber protein [Stenotrophomonas maltophilia]MCO7413234.1 tail fiber protein [Stenotrophomonas maltophilia]